MYYFAVCVRSPPEYQTSGIHSHSYKYRNVLVFRLTAVKKNKITTEIDINTFY